MNMNEIYRDITYIREYIIIMIIIFYYFKVRPKTKNCEKKWEEKYEIYINVNFSSKFLLLLYFWKLLNPFTLIILLDVYMV